MVILCVSGVLACFGQVHPTLQNSTEVAQSSASTPFDQSGKVLLSRGDRTIAVEPYASNIVRITLSVDEKAANAAPGYGIIAKAGNTGWTHEVGPDGYDLIRSNRMVVRISPSSTPEPREVPRNEIYQHLIDKFFGEGRPNPNVHNDIVSIATPDGKPLLEMWRWSMYRNRVPSEPGITDEHKNLDPGYSIAATFNSPLDEHYYGLGEHQLGSLDLRERQLDCWHDHDTLGGQQVCVPFMVSSRKYGFIWDNPSKTKVTLGVSQRNNWSSEVGNSISFFVIAGKDSDEIYAGYRQLTGVTHMLPRAVYGYVQSKCIYPTQEQLLDVAKGYRDRKLPLDVMVVDFLNMSKMGEMDLDPARWPDPAEMNRQLHSMGIKSMLSVWPHLATDSRYYDLLKGNGWFMQKADGSPDQSFWTNSVGPDVDTTNPAAAKWYWDAIKENYIDKDGFDYIWLDETEPDIDPEKDYYSIGSGARFYNVYPLFHTAAVYDGYRRDFGESRRAMILARAAYLGAQRNGTVFWSSDIMSSWDMLRRSITAGLNFTATGMPYWDTDIGGYARQTIYSGYRPEHPALIDGSDARETIDGNTDLPELYVRWFEWGTFQPVMRAHGERKNNEVWSFGKQATPILEKYLRLRYELIPYTYSLAYGSYQTGAPFMRALWMDFANDPKVSNISDEYMYGPALLVAPVTEQGAKSRTVYLPAGADWYNYWTNERIHGGQSISVAAPIDTIPLFVRAGSILPIGTDVLNGDEAQNIASVRVYPGADAQFQLFKDDGKTYGYENGKDSITQLHWNEQQHRFSHTGAPGWSGSDHSVVEIVGERKPK